MAQIKDLKTGIKYKDTPIGKIPVDWEVVRLEDVCDEIYRYPTYYNIKYVEQDGVPEVRGELIKNNGELSSDPSEYRYISKETSANFPRTILHEGDFVLSVRGTMGKIGYIPSNLENANMTANLMRISPNRNKVYPLWLKQFFLSDFFQNSLDQASSATTIKTIKAPELKAIDLALPSLSEQNKIAEILTTVDETIEKTDQIIKKNKEIKKGLMQKLLTRGIDHNKFKKTKIGEIPEEWKIVSLEVLFDFINGHAFYTDGYVNEGYRVIDLLNITIEGKFQLTERDKFVSEEVYNKYPKVHLHKDDIIIIMTDITPDKKLLGKSAVVDSSGKYVLNQRVGCLRKKDETLDLDFIRYAINSDMVHKKFVYHSLGTAQFYINTPTIKGIKVMLPPLSEQYEIAGILSDVDTKIEKEEGYKAKLEHLKKGLMQVLLTGKIRFSV